MGRFERPLAPPARTPTSKPRNGALPSRWATPTGGPGADPLTAPDRAVVIRGERPRRRSVGPCGSLLLTASSSFALTELGEAFAADFLDTVLVPDGAEDSLAAWDHLDGGDLLPRYDREDRVFS